MDAVIGVGLALFLAGITPPAWAVRQFRTYHRHKGLEHDLGPAEIAARLAREAVATATIAMWQVRLPWEEGWRRPAAPRGRPVLCFHGFTGNATNFVGLRRALHARGRTTAAFTLGFPGRPVRGYAPRMQDALDRALGDHPDGVDIVAHSMGGLVLRQVLGDRPDLAAGVRKVVTMGTPHAGTAMARGWMAIGPEAADLRRRSRFLGDLPDLRAVAPNAALTTVAGDFDLVVYPRSTCHVPGSRTVELPVGHASMLVEPHAIAAVTADLDQV